MGAEVDVEVDAVAVDVVVDEEDAGVEDVDADTNVSFILVIECNQIQF